MMTRLITLVIVLASTVAFAVGCASDEGGEKKDDDGLGSFNGPSVTTSEEDGLIIERFTLDDDDKHDVVKYFEEYADPDDESITKRRLRKKEVDVNSDGKIDIVRHYDKLGTLTKEQLDVDLDGNADAISYFDNGELAKKESLSKDASEIVETRFYTDGSIIRVEKDLNNDDKIDYWEYYEEGTLDRIGRDIDADGRADSWTRR
jgi:antitoxin component YwqK of YwqJK toxin-antitoxin module